MNKQMRRAVDIRSCRRALASVFRNIERIATTALKYGADNGDFMGEISEGQAEKANALIGQMFQVSAQAIASLNNAPNAPVAPSEKACSLYCAPARGERGGCVYCGQPKRKHTKEAIRIDRRVQKALAERGLP